MAPFIFYILIGVTGILTITSDLTEKKIKNNHLAIITIIAIFLYLFFIITGEIKASLLLVINPIFALIAGFILYSFRLWKAGDAKLFALYALLIYQNQYSAIIPLSCLVIFLNTFTLGLIYLFPYLIKIIITNKKQIGKEIFSRKTLKFLLNIAAITISISWVISPLLRLLPFDNIFFLEFGLLYAGYIAVFCFIHKIKNKKTILAAIFGAGLALRYMLSPDSFQLAYIYRYFINILRFSLLIYIIRTLTEIEKMETTRVSFAPFLFLGAVLANTDFLRRVIILLSLIRQ